MTAGLLTPAPVEDATRREFITGVGAAALTAAFLAACGGDDGDGEADTVTIDDYFGPVTIPRNPERIIAAEDITLGNMLAIGVKPVGAGVNTISLPSYLEDQMDGVEDVSSEDGIDLEKALSLNPDLIITFAGSPDDPWNKEH